MDSPLQWQRIDLSSHNLVNLTLRWKVADDPELQESFPEVVAGDETTDATVARYKKGDVVHFKIQSIGRSSSDEYLLMVRYTTEGILPTVGPIPKQIQETPEFNNKIGRVTAFPTLQCQAEFELGSAQRYDTAFPLPFELDVSYADKGPIDAITGIRGTKTNTGQRGVPSYTFTLDRRRNGELWLLVEFELQQLPENRSPQNAMKAACDIAAGLVWRTGGTESQ